MCSVLRSTILIPRPVYERFPKPYSMSDSNADAFVPAGGLKIMIFAAIAGFTCRHDFLLY